MLEQLVSSLIQFPPHSDDSLTYKNVKGALRTVRMSVQWDIFGSSNDFTKGIVQGESIDGGYTRRTIEYYLEKSPYASWENIGGQLLHLEEHAALNAVKQFLQPEEGN